ncbi:type IX secretion system membrane protein PorP/SprF [Leptobacterium flavescens]|uniref:Type IX secretion system membrane protein PorP/SprF n=1 Tax=Leptobacterium flavescens TaxID=472055 RepID=A0A6P0UK48_9FLAO|nr:PorP/SprF family type IX secretion system membrane protein [Leptobacterium flavescens]NER13337.1 type IX secretion system membrane protein PorP/SprF [Leptobacterium flavescens]
MFFYVISAQETVASLDFRQHNLSAYNTVLFSPVFSFVGNENPKFAAWGRMQWTELDNSPSTYFTNYSSRIGEYTGIAVGAAHHDAGIFTNISFMGNYARAFQLGENSWLTLGVNVLGTKRTIDRNNFTDDELAMLSTEGRNDFFVSLFPGFNFTFGNFNLGFASENFLDYNFSTSSTETDFSDKIYIGHTSFDINFTSSAGTFLEEGTLRPTFYVKHIPDFETQVGGHLLLDINSGWMQAGYNSFYGPSVGLGAKLFKSIGIGVLAELGNANSDIDLGPTFEFTFAWEFIGKDGGRRKSFAGPVKKKKPEPKPEPVVEEVVEVPEEVVTDTIPEDPYAKFFKPGEKNNRYLVVDRIDGVKKGFYLVVNVYATQKYFNLFMEKLRKDGFDPEYFYNPQNKYTYVYLERYDELEEVEAARANNYGGRYDGETWIMWVRKD